MLKEKKFFAIGTIQDNRTRNFNLKSLKLIAKEPKSTFNFYFDIDYGIRAVCWCNNVVVTIMFNVEHIYAVKCYDRKQKKSLSIP